VWYSQKTAIAKRARDQSSQEVDYYANAREEIRDAPRKYEELTICLTNNVFHGPTTSPRVYIKFSHTVVIVGAFIGAM
jgi:hypothetical protein